MNLKAARALRKMLGRLPNRTAIEGNAFRRVFLAMSHRERGACRRRWLDVTAETSHWKQIVMPVIYP